jgi:hypothetical protein
MKRILIISMGLWMVLFLDSCITENTFLNKPLLSIKKKENRLFHPISHCVGYSYLRQQANQ